MDDDALQQAMLWDAWAEHFPQLYPDQDPTAIVEFLADICPGRPAIELGAGSGRVAIPLARRRDQPLLCIEVSPGLVAHLRKNLEGEPTTVEIAQGDMARLDLKGRKFGLVYAVRSTFFHITEQNRQIDCFRSAARHLDADGRLVLDCFVPDVERISRGQQVAFISSTPDSVELRATSVDAVNQRMTHREVRLENGTLPRVLAIEQRYCWPSELDLMARLGGLQLDGRSADFLGSPFTTSSRRHVSVYRKDVSRH